MKFVIDALYLGQRIVIYERIEYFPLRRFFLWMAGLCNEHMHNSQFSFFPNPQMFAALLHFASTIEIELLLPLIAVYISSAHHVVIKFD